MKFIGGSPARFFIMALATHILKETLYLMILSIKKSTISGVMYTAPTL